MARSPDAPVGCSIEEMVEAMWDVIALEDDTQVISSGLIRLRLALLGYCYSTKQVRDALFRLRVPENIYHHYLGKYGYGRWIGLHDDRDRAPVVRCEIARNSEGVFS